ncbi:SDR family oxidoreductase [Tenggerimyces flavus]|uniref:SDR family oxidoreductase n=1 Tax=Tenggerimyces flavus TaxID=1708749 RepID=A0ABV7YQ36_9ACTN|nr:SDR family oxidoreductase [Tenggerimyces flavus]MBM7784661.1 NAD(P)-dependent dehydrogenase (short-subunit alcohol dehydrogenase family) [Tenggerimyces flavus]
MTKVALVTGGNRGIGLEVARQLAQSGHTVVVGARDAGRGEHAEATLLGEGLDASSVRCDVTDPAVIKAAAEAIAARYGRLDVLVNNAAIAPEEGPPSEATLEVLRATYETNVFGVVTVIQAFLPLLRASAAGRIVNVSSGSGSLAEVSGPGWRAEWNGLSYNTSKSALNALTVAFAVELRDTPVKINAVNPGYTATDMSPDATRSPALAAAVVHRYATLPDDGPSGGFFDENGPIPW